MRGKGLVKLLKAVNLLSRPQGAKVKEIMTELRITNRSVYNLLNMLEELNFPVYGDKSDLGRENIWKLDEYYIKKLPNISVPDLDLKYQDIISLYILWAESGFYKGTEIEKRILSTLRKIGMAVPDNLSTKMSKIKSIFVPISKLSKDYSGKEKIIETLTDAMVNQQTCEVTYHAFRDDQTKEYQIDPLYFFHNNGGLYTFVNILKYSEIRTLAVERIQDITFTKKNFQYPKDFDPEKMLDSAFDIIYDDPVHLKVWFSAEQSKYVKERRWSENQKISKNNDGSVILEMDTSGWWNIKHWVMSFGSHAKVIEPETMKTEILEDLKENIKNYL